MENNEKIREAVRTAYAKVAIGGHGSEAPGASACCGPSSCCGTPETETLESATARLGYSSGEINAAPDGANMALGCGNPTAIASIQEGETVVDLGSGGGFDAFIAGRAVGDSGKVIGVDMTHEMIAKARANKNKIAADNVEFRLGEIEYLPIADNSVDLIISNCVINLSVDKEAVYLDAFRVLKPGGRVAISDVVVLQELPEQMKKDMAFHSGCVAGASTIDEVKRFLVKSGFIDIKVDTLGKSQEIVEGWKMGSNPEDYIASANITAVKP